MEGRGFIEALSAAVGEPSHPIPFLLIVCKPYGRLITTDLHAISYILAHAYDYPKPDFVRDSLATMAAGHEGLLTVEGDVHKRQRRILVSNKV
jgi:cytochrome P450